MTPSSWFSCSFISIFSSLKLTAPSISQAMDGLPLWNLYFACVSYITFPFNVRKWPNHLSWFLFIVLYFNYSLSYIKTDLNMRSVYILLYHLFQQLSYVLHIFPKYFRLYINISQFLLLFFSRFSKTLHRRFKYFCPRHIFISDPV